MATAGPGHATELAARAAGAGAAVVAAVGGDGTVSEVMRGLLGTASALAVLPRGSGNGFARELGMSADPSRFFRQLSRGRRRLIDVGVCAGQPFLLNAGFGIEAHVAHRFAREAGSRRGLWPYMSLAVRAYLRSYRAPRLELTLAGEVVSLAPLVLLAANASQLGAGAVVSPTAKLDDGLLDVVDIKRMGPLSALFYGAKLFSASLDEAPRACIRRAADLTIDAAHALEAELDGDPLMLEPPIVIGVRPRALAVWEP